MLYGREEETGQIHELLAKAVQGQPFVLLVEGPPGIGKRALLRGAARSAQRQGVRVLAATAGPHTAGTPYGVLRDVLDALLLDPAPETVDLLRDPALARLAEGLAADEPDISATDRALFRVLSRLARTSPVLLLLDNVHLADAHTLRWLCYLTDRLDPLPLGVLATLSPAEFPIGPAGRLARDSMPPNADRIWLSALPSPAAADLLHSCVHAREEGDGTATGATDEQGETCTDGLRADVVESCVRLSGGSPLLLRELARDLRHRSTVHDALSPDADTAPERSLRAVAARLAQLPAPVLAYARALAVLDGAADPGLAAKAAALPPGIAAEAAAALLYGGLADASQYAPGLGHHLKPPMVAQALLAGMTAEARAELHWKTAQLAHEQAYPADLAARHLLHSGGHSAPWVRDTLLVAVEAKKRRGDSAALHALLHRLLQEPLEPALRVQALDELGELEIRAGRLEPAVRHLWEAAKCPGTDVEVSARAKSRLVAAMIRGERFAEGVATVREILDETPETDPRQRTELLSLLTLLELYSERSAPSGLSRITELWDPASTDIPQSPQLLRLLLVRGLWEGTDAARVRQLLQAASSGAYERADGHDPHHWFLIVLALTRLGEFSEAVAYADSRVEIATRRGCPQQRAAALSVRSEALFLMGKLRESLRDSAETIEILGPGRVLSEVNAAWAMARRVEALLEQDRLTEIDAIFTRPALRGVLPSFLHVLPLLTARARWHLASGRPQEALADARECGRRLRVWRITNPAVNGWRSVAVIALLRLGRGEEARALAEEQVADARTWGVPAVLGPALRTLAMTATGADRHHWLREAVQALSASGATIDCAWARYDLGMALLRSGLTDPARRNLARAYREAVAHGAHVLADRASSAYRKAGGTAEEAKVPMQGTPLTAAERRTVELALSGLSNREMAEQLSVVQRTVELHLSRAYRKLRIQGRGQLASALDAADRQQ